MEISNRIFGRGFSAGILEKNLYASSAPPPGRRSLLIPTKGVFDLFRKQGILLARNRPPLASSFPSGIYHSSGISSIYPYRRIFSFTKRMATPGSGGNPFKLHSIFNWVLEILCFLIKVPGTVGKFLTSKKETLDKIEEEIETVANTAENVAKTVEHVAEAVEVIAGEVDKDAKKAEIVIEKVEKTARDLREKMDSSLDNLNTVVDKIKSKTEVQSSTSNAVDASSSKEQSIQKQDNISKTTEKS